MKNELSAQLQAAKDELDSTNERASKLEEQNNDLQAKLETASSAHATEGNLYGGSLLVVS